MYTFYSGTIESILSSCNTAPAPSPTTRPCSVLGDQLRDHWGLSSLLTGHLQHLKHAKPPGVTPPIHVTVSSACCHWGVDCRVFQPKPAGSNTVFFHQDVRMLKFLSALTPFPHFGPHHWFWPQTVPMHNLRVYIKCGRSKMQCRNTSAVHRHWQTKWTFVLIYMQLSGPMQRF